jgi:hypothetical protein
MRGQQEMGLGSYGGDWDYVPGVGWDYPSASLRTGYGGYEVQAVFGIGHSVGGYVTFETVVAAAFGGFDLNAEDAAVVFDHEVVGSGVSPGLGDHESALGGAGHETEFGPLSAEFVVFKIYGARAGCEEGIFVQ